jgi:hypothetical protein
LLGGWTGNTGTDGKGNTGADGTYLDYFIPSGKHSFKKNVNVPSVPRFSSPGSPTSATTDRSMLSDVVNEMDKGLPPGQRFGMHVMEAKQLKCGKFEP